VARPARDDQSLFLSVIVLKHKIRRLRSSLTGRAPALLCSPGTSYRASMKPTLSSLAAKKVI
jgi:hypothetical protein